VCARNTSSLAIKHLKAFLEKADRGADMMTDDGRRQSITDPWQGSANWTNRALSKRCGGSNP
jgi:hypothetical protein